jgi:hypothetical protein
MLFFLHRLPSLNTASVAKQQFYIKHLFLGYRYFDILLRIGLDRVLRNTGWVEGRDYGTHGPGRQNDGPGRKLQMHVGEFRRAFQTKIGALTPVFMPVNFGKIFKLQMHVGEFWHAFQTKISALTPVFMPVDFGKVPNPFDFQRLAT